MDFFENRYYNINRLTLSMVGLWPYQNLCRRLVSATVLTLVFGGAMLLIILKMIKTDMTVILLLHCFQFVVTPFIIITDVLYYFFNADKMKILLEHIKCDWSSFEPCDTEIIEPYAEFVRKCNLYITVLGVLFVSVPLLQTSKRSNLNSHSNKTDLIELLLPIHISDVNYDNYFPYFILTLYIILVSGSLVITAVSALYLSSVQHACGIFSITGRMETMLGNISGDTCVYESKATFAVFRSIMFHAKAIGFLNIVNAFFGPLYMTQMILVVMLVSIELFQVTGVHYGSHDFRNSCASFGHFLCVLIIISLFCYTGQLLLDYSNRICSKTYSSQWYVAPLSLQKLVLTIMIRSAKASGITLTKSLTVSFEMLATMLQMSVSYFMAMSSMQQ